MKWYNVFPSVPESFHKSVVNTLETKLKHQHQTRKKEVIFMKKRTIAAICAATIILGAFTVSAATGLLGDIFGFNSKEYFGGGDVSYEVISEAEGYDFEVTSLYADDSSVFLTVDIISDEPMLDQMNQEATFWEFRKADTAYDYVRGSASNTMFDDENRMSVIISRTYEDNEVNVGDEFLVVLPDYDVEIIVTVDELSTDSVTVYPNVATDDGNIAKMEINPYRIKFYYENYVQNETPMNPMFKMSDGQIKDVRNMSGIEALDKFTYAAAEFWGDNNMSMSIGWPYDESFDVTQIEAVIYGDIEIPVN